MSVALFLEHAGKGEIEEVQSTSDGTTLGWAETSVVVTNNPRCAEVAAQLRGA